MNYVIKPWATITHLKRPTLFPIIFKPILFKVMVNYEDYDPAPYEF